MEDLDSLAGNIAFQHCDDADRNTRPQLLVTASVDRVRLLRPLALSEDLVLSGAVAWVGRSSMAGVRLRGPFPRHHAPSRAIARECPPSLLHRPSVLRLSTATKMTRQRVYHACTSVKTPYLQYW